MEAGAIGIDIGSKNTVIAVVRKRGVEIVQSESGNVTPTVVGLGDSERRFGDGAAVNSKSNFKNTVWGVNRFLGMKQNNPHLQEELKFVTARCVPSENKNIGFELRYRGEQRVYSPEQLCSMFLVKLRRIFENAGIGCKDVVVSVPPYFSAVERQALLDAIKISGLNCCRIMNETTAIGLCYGIFRHSELSEKPRHVVFVDLGYSKLTVSAMAFKNTQFSILAQGWEPHLGARNMDAAIIDLLAEEFKKKYKKDFRENPKAMVRMTEATEKVRKILSANIEAPINVESLMDDRDVYHNLTRKEFEQIIAPFLERITNLCKKIMEEAKLKPEDIHSIEMVGEASRIPAVIQCVHECIGATTARTMNSADCVARGCAIQCAMMSPLFKVKDYGIVDCNPFPIDVVYNLPKTEKDPGTRKARMLFEKGCNFPVTKSLSFENRKDPLEIQLKYTDPATLPLGGPGLMGNFKAAAGPVKEDKFTLSVRIALDHNMISTVTSAEVIEDYFEEKKVVIKHDIPVQLKPEAKAEPKPEAKAESKPEAKAEPKPAEKMEDVPHATTSPTASFPTQASASSPAPAPAAASPNLQPQQEYEIQKVPKKRKTVVDIAFEVHGLANSKIGEFVKQEEGMQKEDNMIIETKERKNALESYIYEMKAKIGAELQEYVEPKLAQGFMEQLEKAENWLFGEGQSQFKEAYDSKLAELEKVGLPIILRYKTFGSLADYNLLLSNAHIKAQDFAKEMVKVRGEKKQVKDPKYTDEDKGGLAKMVEEQGVWMKQAYDTLQKCSKMKDPPVKEGDYIEKLHKLEEVPQEHEYAIDDTQIGDEAQAGSEEGGSQEGRGQEDRGSECA